MQQMKRLPYSEGSIFLVPLRDGGYARGVVARSTRQGIVLLGYFFGPKFEAADDATLTDLSPREAILRVRFGDLRLIKGEWPVIGRVANWDRTQWPMPDFIRRDPYREQAWLIRYADDDPGEVVEEQSIEFESQLEPDLLRGWGVLEELLTVRLSP
jgi:Immunity protein 26